MPRKFRPAQPDPPTWHQPVPFSSFISVGTQVGFQASALLAAAQISPEPDPQTQAKAVFVLLSNPLLHLLLWGLWMQLRCSENPLNPHLSLLLLISDATFVTPAALPCQ